MPEAKLPVSDISINIYIYFLIWNNSKHYPSDTGTRENKHVKSVKSKNVFEQVL